MFPLVGTDGKWGDIYPPIPGVSDTGQNWGPDGQAIYNNQCNTDVPVAPMDPIVELAVCTGPGSATVPTVTLAVTNGITYQIQGTVASGNTVTIIAVPSQPLIYKLTAAPGWTLNADGSASFTVVLTIPNCTADVAPVAPTVAQAQCTGPGTSSAPSLTLPSTEGIDYVQTGTVALGNTVTVTATAKSSYKLKAADGWAPNANGTATFTVTFTTPDCIIPATPVAPTVVQAVCTGPGTATTPTIDPATTTGINYVVTGTIAQGQTVTVTATPKTGYKLTTAPGWTPQTDGAASYTFTVEFTTPDCIIPATPVAPTVVQAVCTGPGTATTPTLKAATTTGIDYVVTGTIAQGQTVTVTATPKPGYKLTTAPGWTPQTDGAASYTFTVEFTTPDCIVGASPLPPTVTQAVCTGPGTASTPTIEWTAVKGISYSNTGVVAAGNTVTVTATPAFGYKLNASDGWTLNNDGTATFTVSLAAAPDCIVLATPGTPTVTQAVCTGPGTSTTPTLGVPTNTDAITYSANGTAAQGATVLITATPTFGHSITPGNGWLLNKDGTATFTAIFGTPDCIVPATPGTPTVTQAQCTGPGTATTPTLGLPANTAAITYSADGAAAQGATVHVTATPTFGHSITAGNGWMLNEDGTATFTVNFNTLDCIEGATPAPPVITQAVCAGPGVTTPASLTYAETNGIMYSQNVATAAGATVVVTATPTFGHKLNSANGWTMQADGTATFVVTFDAAPDCIVPATPGTPTVTQAVCTGPGTASTPALKVPGNSDSITYTTDGTVAAGNTVHVIATPTFGHSITAGNGWMLNEDGTATYTATFGTPDCIVGATPAAPTVTQAVCTGPGMASTPTITWTAVKGISYSNTGVVGAGNTVTVTATPDSGYKLNSADGWTLNQDGTASFTIKFSAAPDCIIPATPGTPTATQAVCTGPGAASTPTLTVPANTDTITYSTNGTVAEGNTVHVIATPAFGYSITAGNGWMLNEDGTASYTFTFKTLDCIVGATPAAPAATQAVCAGPGVTTPPTLTPATTDGIMYSQNVATAAGATVVVTATPTFGHKLNASDGWTVQENGTATYTVTFAAAPDCIVPGTPGTPTAAQAVCTGPGMASAAELTVPANTDGITYTTSGPATAGTTVTVTATPEFGYSISASDGWTLHEDGTASYQVEFSTPDCIVPATPKAPTVTQTVCTGPGTASTPELAFAETEGITYSQDVDTATGAVVAVTATPNDGYKLAAAEGWTAQENGSATYQVEFSTPDCIVPGTPEAPTANQAVCTGPGTATTPELTVPANSDGITYSTEGTAAQGETVRVTATPAEGYSLTEGNGWMLNEDGTASYEIHFDTVDCVVAATPSAPTVTQAVCTNGTVSTPTLALATTKGITYTTAGTPATGKSATVTAVPADGYKLAATAGWTAQANGTATFLATFNKVACPVAVDPPAPPAPPAPLASTGFDSGWSISLAIMFLVVGAGAVWRNRRPAAH
ncbi:hypothetical protein QO003_003626 [Arthrobacter silviterrae]|uniref:Bacterial repeat domain-containing protein n=1 Tax=Arthrobacter silviterrae TaxID=2026658 RepID=A0ABX0DCD5_9MICC|nr:hypothetical protein [Arthrobacter silviterrae]MDQ0279323.1 hypothetical protein [Arthrobacter silviterrae]NGN83475.1 hypothetical protein [Arthrobacter silviterrae]